MRSALVLLAIFVLACRPMGETPGLRLGGSDAGSPASFAFARDHEEIQLEAWGSVFPRVVNIWCVGFDDALYVWGDPGSGWVKRVAERPDDVRVRIGDSVYELSAAEVDAAAEKKRVVAAYKEKYAEALDEIFGRSATVDDFELLYRLTPRS
jgi:hypothetical protein